MQATGAVTGQLWRFVPSSAGHRLSTQWQGDAKHLGIEGDLPVLVKGGTQSWQVERASDASYRVRAAGDTRCLAAGLRILLVACADTPDQRWILTPTSARAR